MELEDVQKNWNAFGEKDPLWAILTDAEKRGNKWDKDEFFQTGVQEINGVLAYLDSLGTFSTRRTALDFGCGVGRLTQALAPHFEAVTGLDIAPSMIALAEEYNRFGDKCRYVVNGRDDLTLFSDDQFDFIYSNIVLQHMKPEYSQKYIREFCRVLAPHGALVFQLPFERLAKMTLREKVRNVVPPAALDLYRRKKGSLQMEMYCATQEDVIKIIESSGAKLVDVQPDSSAQGFSGFRYCATKD